MNKFLSLAISLLTAASTAHAEDWLNWRGPNGLGVSKEIDLPAVWSKETNVAWKVAIPGFGASSPIVAADSVYVTSQTENNDLHVLRIDVESGEIVWDKVIGNGTGKTHRFHNMATPTPTSDVKSVFALFGTGDLACLNRQGEVFWQRNLQRDHGKYTIQWGMASSPMHLRGKLYLTCMQQGASYLLAKRTSDGGDIFRIPRTLGPANEARDSYTNPIFVPGRIGTELILAGAFHLTAYNPDSGRQIWKSGGLEVPHHAGRTISGPTYGNGVIMAASSGWRSQGHVVAIRSKGLGDITESHRLWKNEKLSPDCPTPIIYQGLAYVVKDNGITACLDPKTGKVHWEERLFKVGGKVSPVAGDNKIYVLNSKGKCVVLMPGKEKVVISENDLDEDTIAAPAIAQGKLFIRTKSQLYAIKRD